MAAVALALALVAALLALVELVNTRGRELLAWATLALAAVIVLPRVI